MKKYTALIAVAAALVAATPAAANEFRVEARGGVTFGDTVGNEAVAGVAAGYDFDLSEGAFVGLEASADKVLVEDAGVVLGATARLGMKEGNSKFFIAGGYTELTCDSCGNAIHAGFGLEHGFTQNFYGKLEYRHFFNAGPETNVVAAGVGVRF